ncbi:MAG: hypothetical protein AB8G05_15355 [Oligoflexales bacterium]
MGKIKSFFWFILVVSIALVVLVALSLRGEKNYLENCRTLSVKCEPGRMHTTLDHVSKWLGDSYTQAKRDWDKESKGGSLPSESGKEIQTSADAGSEEN